MELLHDYFYKTNIAPLFALVCQHGLQIRTIWEKIKRGAFAPLFI